MSEVFHVVPRAAHEALVTAAYVKRGFGAKESAQAAQMASMATHHGIRTHNALKALHLDELFGSGAKVPGCTPNASVTKKATRFEAAEVWDAHQKLGQAVAAVTNLIRAMHGEKPLAQINPEVPVKKVV